MFFLLLLFQEDAHSTCDAEYFDKIKGGENPYSAGTRGNVRDSAMLAGFQRA